MTVDYKQGGDTGEANSASVQPVTSGEAVTSTVTNRPTDNLRVRTDTLKVHMDQHESLLRTDRGLICTADGTVTFEGAWDGVSPAPAMGVDYSGGVDLEAGKSLFIRPIGSPSTTTFASLTTNSELTFTALKYDFMGGNEIEILIETDTAVAAGAAVVTMQGGSIIFDDVDGVNPKLQNRIRIGVTGTTTLSTVKTAVDAAAVATDLVDVTLVGAAGDIVTTFAVDKLSGGVDSELHEIQDATLATFFATEANRLQQGDSLCIAYTSDIYRRQSIVGGPTTHIVPVASLFNSRANPEKLHFCMPVLTVPDGQDEYAVTLNGLRLDKQVDTTLGEGSSTLASSLASTSTGTTLIGDAGIAGSPTSISSGTLRSVLVALLAAINARVQKSGGEITGSVTVKSSGSILTNTTGRPIGSSSGRFDAFLEDVTLYGSMLPGAGGADEIGQTGSRISAIHGDTMSATYMTLGADSLSSATAALAARTTANHRTSATNWTLMWRSDDSAATQTSFAIYARSDEIAIAQNCIYTESPATVFFWQRIQSDDAFLTVFTLNGIRGYKHPAAGAATWNDTVSAGTADWSEVGVTFGNATNTTVGTANFDAEAIPGLIGRLGTDVTTGSENKVLLFEPNDDTDGVRIYIVDSTATLEITTNAKWVNSGGWKWVSPNPAGDDATLVRISQDGLVYRVRSASATHWDDTDSGTGWQQNAVYADLKANDVTIANSGVNGHYRLASARTYRHHVPIGTAHVGPTTGSEWQRTGPVNIGTNTIPLLQKTGTAAGQASFSLNLPQNATITAVQTVIYNPTGNGGESVNWALVRRSRGINSGTGLADTGLILTSTGAQETIAQASSYESRSLTLTATTSNLLVDNSSYTYFIWFGIPSGTGPHTIYIAQVDVDYTIQTLEPA